MPLTSLELRKAIRAKYAWPGGYPMYLLMADCEAMCIDCGRKEYKLIARARRDAVKGGDPRDQWNVEAVDINWEDPSLYCCHCNERIESAYAEDDLKEVP